MPSWDGLKTWFDYELLMLAGAITIVLTLWTARQVGVGLQLVLPPVAVDSPTFAVGFLLSATVAMGVLFWLAAQYGESANR